MTAAPFYMLRLQRTPAVLSARRL